MKRFFLFLPILLLCRSHSFAQDTSYVQPASLGIHVSFNDFASALAIRNSSLGNAIRENQFGRVKNMTQGLALTYRNGLSGHFDFHSMLNGCFLAYPFDHIPTSRREYLLIEIDASLKGKLLTDKHRVIPFATAGMGISKYQGYWATYIPTGIGMQINFFDEAYLVFHAQYRTAVTENAVNHFFYSVGLAGNIRIRD